MYREPGKGAIEFARQFVEGRTRDEAIEILRDLLNGNLHDKTDKRIKKCSTCGYYYRDRTKNNSSKTCSRECKIKRDTLRRAEKNAEKALLKQKTDKEIEKLYLFWLDYPFFISEKYMSRKVREYESSYSYEKLALIDAARQRCYKRKNKNTQTDGSDKVHVRGLSHASKGESIVTTKISPEEIDAYFFKKYGTNRLRQERKHAELFSRSKFFIYG